MWIYNGCGWEGGLSFSKVVRHNVELFPKYKAEKAIDLWEWIEDDICKPHDKRFYIWGLLYAYIKANFIFAYNFTLKLWWTNYIVFFLSFPILFIWLNVFWVSYFNWCMPWNKRIPWEYISNLK